MQPPQSSSCLQFTKSAFLSALPQNSPKPIKPFIALFANMLRSGFLEMNGDFKAGHIIIEGDLKRYIEGSIQLFNSWNELQLRGQTQCTKVTVMFEGEELCLEQFVSSNAKPMLKMICQGNIEYIDSPSLTIDAWAFCMDFKFSTNYDAHRLMNDKHMLRFRYPPRVIDFKGVDFHVIESDYLIHCLSAKYADLSGANLSGLELQDVDFGMAILDRINLTRTNLCGANLSRVKMDGVIIKDANFGSAIFNGHDRMSLLLPKWGFGADIMPVQLQELGGTLSAIDTIPARYKDLRQCLLQQVTASLSHADIIQICTQSVEFLSDCPSFFYCIVTKANTGLLAVGDMTQLQKLLELAELQGEPVAADPKQAKGVELPKMNEPVVGAWLVNNSGFFLQLFSLVQVHGDDKMKARVNLLYELYESYNCLVMAQGDVDMLVKFLSEARDRVSGNETVFIKEKEYYIRRLVKLGQSRSEMEVIKLATDLISEYKKAKRRLN